MTFAYDPHQYTKLISRLAKRFAWACGPNGITHEDLMQAGYTGLAIAARKFDPARKIKFITYAMWWVRSEIAVQAGLMARAVRVPRDTAQKAYHAGEAFSLTALSLDHPEQAWLAEGDAPDTEEPESDAPERVSEAMGQLPERHRRVLHLRFFRDATLKDIGLELGVSRERARQLEAEALEMARAVMPCNPLVGS